MTCGVSDVAPAALYHAENRNQALELVLSGGSGGGLQPFPTQNCDIFFNRAHEGIRPARLIAYGQLVRLS